MKKFLVIGIIALGLVVLGFALYSGGPKQAVSQTDAVTVQNADEQTSDKCGDNCADCPEKMEGECSGHSVEAADCPETEKCTDRAVEHEKGSKECEELKAAGKCPHTCPGHKTK